MKNGRSSRLRFPAKTQSGDSFPWLNVIMTSRSFRVWTIHRYLLCLLLASTCVTMILVVHNCLGTPEQCVFAPPPLTVQRSDHIPQSAEALRNNYGPHLPQHLVSFNINNNMSSDEELALTYEDAEAGNRNNVQGRILKESSREENVLESGDVDYALLNPQKKKMPERVTNPKRGSKFSGKKALKLYSEKGLMLRSQFNCGKLFKGDEVEQEKVTAFHRRYNNTFPTLSSSEVPSMLSDCGAFKTARGYRTETDVSTEEREFPLAYVILVHLDFEHVERLIRTLYTPQNVFCIHLDAKATDSLKAALTALVSCFPNNLMLSTNPQRIVYAHMSRLMADISCMRDIVHSKKPWRYLINMAATELPLKSNLDTIHILKTLHGLNDIRENEKAKISARYEWAYRIENGRLKKTTQRLPPPPHNITIVKGLAYNTFSREFMDWVMTDQRARDLLTWSELTYSPDEHYWGSLNDLYHNDFLNAPGGFRGHPDKKGYITKFISWQQQPKHKCRGRVTHNICLFSALDLPALVNRRELAANKFDLTFDPLAYACVEEVIENRTRSSDPLDLAPYKKLYFVKFDPAKDGAKLNVDKKIASDRNKS